MNTLRVFIVHGASLLFQYVSALLISSMDAAFVFFELGNRRWSTFSRNLAVSLRRRFDPKRYPDYGQNCLTITKQVPGTLGITSSYEQEIMNITKSIYMYRKLSRDINFLSFILTLIDAFPKNVSYTLTIT